MKNIILQQRLSHPNVVRYMGSWVSNLELFIALELADAGDLASMIKHFKGKEKPLPEASIWKFFVQICAGVNHMHEKRIMHRGQILFHFYDLKNKVPLTISQTSSLQTFLSQPMAK